MKEVIEKLIARILFATFIIVMLDIIFVFTVIIIDSINVTDLFNKYNEIPTNLLVFGAISLYKSVNLLVFGAIVAAFSSASIILINIKDIWNSLK